MIIFRKYWITLLVSFYGSKSGQDWIQNIHHSLISCKVSFKVSFKWNYVDPTKFHKVYFMKQHFYKCINVIYDRIWCYIKCMPYSTMPLDITHV